MRKRWDTLEPSMRTCIELGPVPAFNPLGLQGQEVFLYRRLGDQRRGVLGVGVMSHAGEPVFDGEGRVSDWTFGHACYDLKEELHGLRSPHSGASGFPVSHWFVPRWVIEWRGGLGFLHILAGDEVEARAFADRLLSAPRRTSTGAPLVWRGRTSREGYLDRAARLMEHIQRGDIYEVNYCIERTAIDKGFDPFGAFARLLAASDAPFSGFYRMHDRFVLCASPERFLSFQGPRVKGEPMKGTRPRGADEAEDERLRKELATDAKERSENIMAVDVMRNDLSQIAVGDSVKVEELCAVRTYPRVHQLVSTIVAEMGADHTPYDVLRASFPMASMTGAPKYSAMRLIDTVEDQRRGLYSGTLGFFAPDGTADLNVVIRTILFDAAKGDLSLSTGSALTAQCDPQKEWEECEMKARSVIDALAP